MQNFFLKALNPNKLEITNYNIQVSNKIKRQLFGILDFSLCDLPFDLAQGGGELVEPFDICDLLFEIFNCRNPWPRPKFV